MKFRNLLNSLSLGNISPKIIPIREKILKNLLKVIQNFEYKETDKFIWKDAI